MLCEQCKVPTHIIDDPSNGCYVCTECGLVVSEVYTEDESWFDKSLGQMSHESKSPFQIATQKFRGTSYTTFFSTQDNHQIKLVHFNKRFQLIAQSFSDMSESVLEGARTLYLSIEGKTSMKGRNLDYIICALIIISAKQHSRVIDTSVFDKEHETEIIKSIAFTEEALGVKQVICNPEETVFADAEIESHIVQFCSHYPQIGRRARRDIIKLIPKTEFIMRKKNAVAAALIIHHLRDRSMIKDLSMRFSLSDTTIRSALKDLKKV
jgi:transcription initiation factor TFIIB